MDNVLDLEFQSRDLRRKVSIREFFYLLIDTFWVENEDFSVIRPFGNSQWDGDLIRCLVQNKLIDGEIDDAGYIDSFDRVQLNTFVREQILKPLCGITKPTVV